MSLLALNDLHLSIGGAPILEGVALDVEAGRVLGIVGESGSGKSLTALSILQLLPNGASLGGSVVWDGREMIGAGEAALTDLRGDEIGMIFQEPMTALNPLMTIGDQVAETVMVHKKVRRAKAMEIARATLVRVGLPEEKVAASRYPHELSGGQRQRVGIAMAIALRPRLLIADEPTTALDVTTQAQILDLLRELVVEDGMALMLITHDLAVVSQMAHSVVVLKSGRVVESGATQDVLAAPKNEYTQRLLAASQHIPARSNRKIGEPLLIVDGVVRDYRLKRETLFAPRRVLRAVSRATFSIAEGESVGLVGESGSGKSTLARAVLGLETPDAGTISLRGKPIDGPKRTARVTRREMQMVFQDPYGSFDPRHKVERLITEPLHLLGGIAPLGDARERRVEAALEAVGLSAGDADKYIHEFSGGQRQRLAIARALIIEPALVVLDEAVSALDVSIRAQILDLLGALSDRMGLSYLFIAHDLHVVRAITDRVLIMKDGVIVEQGETEAVFRAPSHPYSRALIDAAPRLETRDEVV